MSGINIDFMGKFHPVGHGLFYSASITIEGKSFNIVYDCGSGNGKSACEDKIKNSSIGDTIDLLIISHFHEDHINGIAKLVEEVSNVKMVVMPYLTLAEKIYQLGQLYYQRSESDPEFAVYENLIKKPSEIFRDAEIVYLIAGERGDSREESPEEFDNPEGYPNGYWSEYKVRGPDGTASTEKISFYKHSVSLKLPYWIFRFYINKPTTATSEKLNELYETLKGKGVTLDNFSEKFSEIKHVYRDQFKSREANNTSVVCCHGPRIHGVANSFYHPAEYNYFESMSKYIDYYFESRCHFEHIHFSCCWHCFLPAGFQMLTGDADIKDEKDYKSHFFDVLNRVVLFQIPHHGSKDSWKEWFIGAHPVCKVWACTHNDNNKYRAGTFPSASFDKSITISSVTENKHLCFDGDIEIH